MQMFFKAKLQIMDNAIMDNVYLSVPFTGRSSGDNMMPLSIINSGALAANLSTVMAAALAWNSAANMFEL
jgi:hypothetical protein